MNKKKIAVLGSTGSVGRQALEVIRKEKDMCVTALTANTNRALLERQITEFSPKVACLASAGEDFDVGATHVYGGADGLIRAVETDADVVFVAVTGFCGLRAVLHALELGKHVALANKEALVAGGALVTKAAENAEIIPVDSEHSALWQALGFCKKGYKRLILTASGGPFLHAEMCEMRHFSAKDALRHPNWNMGEKITVDCATMLNKGFEVIEAHHLFGAPLSKIDVVVHPQSIIHSMVEFEDNSVMAEMSYPSMEQPVRLALTYPERRPSALPPLDFAALGRLEFLPLDRAKFPCFDIAVGSLRLGDNYPCAMNAASEVAVRAFLDGKIAFTDIAEVISDVVGKTERLSLSLASLEHTDERARALASAITDKISRTTV